MRYLVGFEVDKRGFRKKPVYKVLDLNTLLIHNYSYKELMSQYENGTRLRNMTQGMITVLKKGDIDTHFEMVSADFGKQLFEPIPQKLSAVIGIQDISEYIKAGFYENKYFKMFIADKDNFKMRRVCLFFEGKYYLIVCEKKYNDLSYGIGREWDVIRINGHEVMSIPSEHNYIGYDINDSSFYICFDGGVTDKARKIKIYPSGTVAVLSSAYGDRVIHNISEPYNEEGFARKISAEKRRLLLA